MNNYRMALGLIYMIKYTLGTKRNPHFYSTSIGFWEHLITNESQSIAITCHYNHASILLQMLLFDWLFCSHPLSIATSKTITFQAHFV